MKGQAKRFLNHSGKAYEVGLKKIKPDRSIGFFDLWRYASGAERAATASGAALAWLCACALVAAVAVYGELTALFVARHRAAPHAHHAHLLALFGGGQLLAAGNRTLHMEALVRDSVAFGAASVAIMALQLASAAAAVSLANWAAARMVTRLRLRLLRAVICQEMAFFDTNTSLNFASTLTEDMEKLRSGVGEHVSMTSYLAGTVVCGAGLALASGWRLTLAGLAVVPAALLLAALVSKYQTRYSAEEVTAYSAAGRVAEEALSAIRTVRAYAGEEVELQRYTAALGGAGRAARARGLWAGAGAGLGWLLTYSLNAIVFAYGAALCVRDMDLPPDLQEYHPGVMVTVLFCTFMAAQNITMCHPHLEVFSAARGAAESLFALLERKSNIDALEERGLEPASFRGDVAFDNVHFSYPSRPDVKVLRGLSLLVPAGATVALVGGSGSGKSTVLQLLQRLYSPDAGAISVDGHRLPDLNLHRFRSSIGVVGQEPVLFSGTIRDNITLGAGDVSDADVIAAARTANAHHFITKLARGYETMVGAGGAALSGGQKQRVALARAVLRRPALLLLDEPTSALDPAAERQVQAALDAASKGRTTVVVSHRLSTIAEATRIVYLERGSAAEEGSHAELMARRGLYWRLVTGDIAYKGVPAALPAAGDDDEIPEREETDLFQRSQGRSSVAPRRGNAAFTHKPLDNFESLSRATRGSGRLVPSSVPLAPTTERESESEREEAAAAVSSAALLRLHRPEWRLVAAGGLASFTVGATMPAFAFLFSKLYGMFSWSDGEAILRQSRLYAGLFLAVAAVCGAVTFLQAWLFNVAGARLTERLRRRTFRAYLRQDQSWFDQSANSVGSLCARLAADCAAVQGATGTRLGTVLQGVSTMVIGVGLAALYSWKMTLVSLLSVPCVIGGIYLEGWANKRAETAERRALERASRVATEAVLHVRTVQSLGVEREMLARYEEALRAAASGAAPARAVRGAVYGLCLCAPTLGYAVSLAYGGYLIARDDLQYEYAILVSEALIYGAWMLAEALSFAPSFAAARRSGARILAAIAREPEIVSDPAAIDDPDWKVSGEVSLSGVRFSYPGRAEVLRGLSLRAAAGRTLALVGPSGCGKSTVMQLLLRSYDAHQGRIEVDGRDARRSVPLARLRAALGLVSQEPALFSRTIRENIAYGDNSRAVPAAEVVRAAQQADIHSFVSSLPLGYETPLGGGGGGAALSGGQKQRVAIARALVRDPRVLLLDEATSALDAHSERAVQAALEAAALGRTTLVVSHRLAAVRGAHTIAVIDKGVVAESGSHEELVRRRGLYWGLLRQEAPSHAGALDHTGESDHAGESHHAGESDHAGESHHAGESDHAGESHHAGESDHAEVTDHAGESDHHGISEHAA